jgi:hypothetical protein
MLAGKGLMKIVYFLCMILKVYIITRTNDIS